MGTPPPKFPHQGISALASSLLILFVEGGGDAPFLKLTINNSNAAFNRNLVIIYSIVIWVFFYEILHSLKNG